MLSDALLCTEVFLDGESLGMCIRAPFVFDIPEKLRSRRATIRITQYSSIGEIFGDTRYYDDVAEHLSWRGTPPTSKTLFGADVSFLISR
jgi:hypothetical protein